MGPHMRSSAGAERPEYIKKGGPTISSVRNPHETYRRDRSDRLREILARHRYETREKCSFVHFYSESLNLLIKNRL